MIKQLRATDITLSYGTKRVLNDCSLTIEPGEVVALVGRSGAGKTTLIQVLSGILVPDSGSVYLGDQQVTSPAAGVSVVFQDFGLLPWRTALRNVEFPMEVARIRRRDRREQALAALEEVGLTSAASLYPHQLSGGMQQRVAIARGLVSRPSVLLLDEPFAALDVSSRDLLRESLTKIRQEVGLTIVLVTHDLEEAAGFADRAVVLGERVGRIVREESLLDAAARADGAGRLAKFIRDDSGDPGWGRDPSSVGSVSKETA